MSIEIINDLAQSLVADDYSTGHSPNQAGPTKTARALAIIHLAAHDAYAQVTGKFPPRLGGLPAAPGGGAGSDAEASVALIAAGCRAALHLYPDFARLIEKTQADSTPGADPALLAYGATIGEAWLASRLGDGSDANQFDVDYKMGTGFHRPDPFNPNQMTLGRKWGSVAPFVLTSVTGDAPLGAPPALDSNEYALAYGQVFENGSSDLTERDAEARHMAAVGIFWAYDGTNKLGTPPRLYNQVVRKIPAVVALPHEQRVRMLTAVNAAMADAGIAAWHWKYAYDLWRPIVGIREADAGWGPLGTGDRNTHRNRPGNPFWRPLGAPRSNPVFPFAAGAAGDNFTPNFPAYPSGHATFGSACFATVANLLKVAPQDVPVTVGSDEFNGATTNHNGVTRPKWVQTLTLRTAIEQNSVSRIFLGVHWIFDATGGETVGTAIATKVAAAFPLVEP